MIQFPRLQANTKTKQYTVTFGGLNETEHFSEGEFRKTENLSVDGFPAISQRAVRADTFTLLPFEATLGGDAENVKIESLGDQDGFVYMIGDHNTLPPTYTTCWEHISYHSPTERSISFSTQMGFSYGSEARMLNQLVVFPEGAILTDDGENVDVETIAKTFTSSSSVYVGWFSAASGGTDQYRYGIGFTSYSGDSSDYARVSAMFKTGDTVKTSGTNTSDRDGKIITIRGFADVAYKGSTRVSVLCTDENIFDPLATSSASITLTRECPDIDMCCEWNNRIWGVYSSAKTIYASALGDPANYMRYNGTATDAWALDVGTEGKFTALATFGTNLIVFKENCLHKIYGTTPSSFGMQTILAPGVQEGSRKSVCLVNGILYYKGADGVYAYDGSYPVKVSGNITGTYYDAVAGSDGERYYISMRDKDNVWGMWCYDTTRGTWIKEDGVHALGFGLYGNVLYYVDAADSSAYDYPDVEGKLRFKLKAIYRGLLSPLYLDDVPADPPFEWSGTLCPINETVKDEKKYSRLWLRAELTAPGCYIRVEYSCDGKPYEEAGVEAYNERKPVVEIPIRPDRCDSLSIRVSGKGRVNLRGLIREVAV